MLMLDLLKLQNRWRIKGITAHDLLNWLEGKIELCYHDERLNDGSIKVWVNVFNPNHFKVERTTRFAKELASVVKAGFGTVGEVVREADILDRFRSGGKLYLVLRNGKVVNEESVRVYGNACRSCKAVPSHPRDGRLFARQQQLCSACFTKLLPEALRWPYCSSTLESYRRVGGYAIHYDPILGSSKLVRVPHDSDGQDPDGDHNERSRPEARDTVQQQHAAEAHVDGSRRADGSER